MSKLSAPQEAALRSAERLSGRFFAEPRTTRVLVELGYAREKRDTYLREGYITEAGREELARLDGLREAGAGCGCGSCDRRL